MPPTPSDYSASIDTDGFAIVDHVITPDQIRRLIDALSAVDVARTPNTSRRRGTSYAMRNLLPVIRRVDNLPESSELLDLVRPILGGNLNGTLGGNISVVRGILFDKNSDANWAVGWHQDCAIAVRERIDVPGFGPWSTKAGVPHVQPPTHVLENMLTLRLHLDDCPDDNGPLQVVLGSHRRGMLDSEQVRDCYTRGPIRSLSIAAGGVVVMRPLLLHSSRPSHQSSHRRVIHIEYAGVMLNGGLNWPE